MVEMTEQRNSRRWIAKIERPRNIVAEKIVQTRKKGSSGLLSLYV